MRLVIVESPYAGDVQRNLEYARDCVFDCLNRNEAPFASHLLYPLVLNDNNHDERIAGIEAGLAWGKHADATVVYCDHGISEGMAIGIARANLEGRKVEYRRLLPLELKDGLREVYDKQQARKLEAKEA